MKKLITLLLLVLLSMFAQVACASAPVPLPCEVQLGKLKGAPLDQLTKVMMSSRDADLRECVGAEMVLRGETAIPVLRKLLAYENSRTDAMKALAKFGARAHEAVPDIIRYLSGCQTSVCIESIRSIGVAGQKNVAVALEEILRNGAGLSEFIYKDAPAFSDLVIERLAAKMFQVQCHDTNNPYMGLLAHTKKPQAAEYLVRYLSECANSKPENYAYFKPMCTSCSDAVSTLGNISFPLLVKRVNDPNGSYGLPARLDARMGEVDQRLRRIDQRLLAAVVLSKVGGPAEQRVIDDFARKVAPSLLDGMKSPSCRERDEASFRLAALAKLVGAKYGLSAKYPRLDCRKAN